ncbi:MAG: hypothetical protein LBT31_10700 [Synergistaceae bacterium]|jgi:hypothetical protein|nr:hypothetical protein [Synergistaceae bacterium]
MQFKVFEPDIEVNAPTVSAIIAGLGRFTNISRRYLSQVGIGTVVDKKLVLDIDAWYSQDAWLRAFENIANQIGDRLLFNIGMSIPNNARFPSWVTDIESAVRSIDVAYHLNHRKDGVQLFDTETGVMREGIGHYGCEPMEGENEIRSVSNNPYPCAFDRGIITAMAHKFKPDARVVHDDSAECRKNGVDSCTYHVYW